MAFMTENTIEKTQTNSRRIINLPVATTQEELPIYCTLLGRTLIMWFNIEGCSAIIPCPLSDNWPALSSENERR